MVRLPFTKRAMAKGGVAVFAAAAGTAACIHFSAMAEYADFEQRVKDAQTGDHTEGYVAYAGTTERIQTAFRLAEENPGSRILISGGNAQYGLDDVVEEFETTLTPDRITFLSYAQNTKGNALETLMWAKSLKLDSVTVITDASHAPRAYRETDRVLPDSISMAFHVVGDFPEAGSWERMEQAYKLWCVARPLCESMMRDKSPMRDIVPIPKSRAKALEEMDMSPGGS
ncbi:MAG: YdcF family protein [Alphaproteobacteria bacterium]|nr:YdcF family protein [Alphaproteobacteria bacterium]